MPLGASRLSFLALGAAETLVTPSASGGTESTITDAGTEYKVHQFTTTGNSTFTVSTALVDAEVLIVAGGGAGGIIGWGAGGGAGALIEGTFDEIASGSYTVTVGAGGLKGTDGSNGETGGDGGNSVFNGLTALGGGGGAGGRNSSVPGNDGGSGGGGNADRAGTNLNVGGSTIQTQPSVSGFTGTAYGNDGGDGNLNSANGGAGGGGGAGAVGGTASQSSSVNVGADGGIGRQSSITGTTKYYADGGGGAGSTGGGVGGSGTGGNGYNAAVTKPNGDANSGSGGGGDRGNGGSGIVVIRYPTASYSIGGASAGTTHDGDASISSAFSLSCVATEIAAPSRTAITTSAIGNAQLDTAQKKFGTASLLLDGNDAVTLNNFPNLGSGNFTVEMWARPASFSNASYDALFTWQSQQEWETENSSNDAGFVLSVGALHYGTSANTSYSSGMSTGSWQHMALVRNGSSWKVYKNGTQVLSISNSNTYNNNLSYTKPAIGVFDRLAVNGGRLFFNGHIDELRISDTARYTSNFTPPTSEFTNDSNTLALFHFNGSDGSTTFTDDN